MGLIMIEKVKKTIDRYSLIQSGDRIVVGVSGGPDSMCLLHILKRLQNEYDIFIVVAHVDHGIRGEQSRRDADFVEYHARKMGFDFYLHKQDVGVLARNKGISLELAGREVRYFFFNDVLKKIGGNKVATAHNKNDNCETMLFNFMRGTGAEGLTGIKPITDDMIIRPLIEVSRDEIEAYCASNHIPFRIDSTNEMHIYTRNRIRLELIPYIRENFNPEIVDALYKTRNIIDQDNQYLNMKAGDILKGISRVTGDKVVLDRSALNSLHPSLFSRVLRLAVKKLKGDIKSLEYKHVQRMMDFSLNAGVGACYILPGGYRLRVCYKEIILEPNRQTRISSFCYKVKIPGYIYIEEVKGTLQAEIINKDQYNSLPKTLNTAFFDGDRITSEINVRNRRSGDVFSPLGMKGTKKLKDFFIDIKIPKEQRDSLPLITIDNTVLWVIGYRISEKYKVIKETKKIVYLKYLGNQ
jgi:tRNA(Ile)-lysidine synthase